MILGICIYSMCQFFIRGCLFCILWVCILYLRKRIWESVFDNCVCVFLVWGKYFELGMCKFCIWEGAFGIFERVLHIGSVYIVFGIVNQYVGVSICFFGVCIRNLGSFFLECVFWIWGSICCITGCVFWSVSLVFWGVYLVFGGMKLVYEGVLWYLVFVFHKWGYVFVFFTFIFCLGWYVLYLG